MTGSGQSIWSRVELIASHFSPPPRRKQLYFLCLPGASCRWGAYGTTHIRHASRWYCGGLAVGGAWATLGDAGHWILSSRSPAEATAVVNAFRSGLGEVGYFEGKNVTIEYRWAEGRYDPIARAGG